MSAATNPEQHGDQGHGHGHGHGHGPGHGHGNGHGHDQPDPHRCLPIPRLERVNYFHGQMLGVREFRSEQAYFREKQKLHNRYLHGSGVVCGLAVTPCPVEPHDDCAPHTPPPCVVIQCGLAIDCCGNEIVVREPRTVVLAHHLSVDQRRHLAAEGGVLWVSICYREQEVQPTRPLSVDECGTSPAGCVHAMVRDDFCVRVSPERPERRPDCSACSDDCSDGCLLLARVRVDKDCRVDEQAIDNGVRRPMAPYDTTRIDRIGWTHGAQYTREEASGLLTKGLYFHFTRPVRASTVTAPGVFDLWAIEGGRGRRGLIYHIDTRAETEPDAELVRWVRFQNLTDEVLQPGDRVLVMMRSGFVLDDCCRSLDGDHAGGLAIDRDYGAWDRSSEVPAPPCTQPPPRHLTPWLSGNGEPAGNFESWFYIEADPHHQPPGPPQPGPSSRRSKP